MSMANKGSYPAEPNPAYIAKLAELPKWGALTPPIQFKEIPPPAFQESLVMQAILKRLEEAVFSGMEVPDGKLLSGDTLTPEMLNDMATRVHNNGVWLDSELVRKEYEGAELLKQGAIGIDTKTMEPVYLYSGVVDLSVDLNNSSKLTLEEIQKANEARHKEMLRRYERAWWDDRQADTTTNP